MASEPIDRLMADAEHAADMIRKAKDVLIVAHIDADGITSAAIASKTCERLGKEYNVLFANKMDSDTIHTINTTDKDTVWIVDLGSGYLSDYKRDRIVVSDHHVPDPKWRRGQLTLDSFQIIEHVNCHTYEMDGSTEACGATTTYLISKAIDQSNRDLAYLGVIGACGDLQDRNEYGLIGINRIALNDAIANGDVIAEKDLRLFGRASRPLVQFIQYSNDPNLDGLTDDSHACHEFFDDLGIPLTENNVSRKWLDLSPDEKQKVRDALKEHIRPCDEWILIGETYTLPRFPLTGGLRDAKEFATSLNSCGRYDDAPTGVKICFGEQSAMADAERNRAEHRKNISSALQYVKHNDLIHRRQFIQYFDAGDAIKDTVVGIVAGMILSTEGFNRMMPIIAFAKADDGVKVSARADRSPGERGLDRSIIMNRAAGIVGGYGGGHNVAAGATIPVDKEDQFLDIVEDMVASQLI